MWGRGDELGHAVGLLGEMSVRGARACSGDDSESLHTVMQIWHCERKEGRKN